MKERGCHRSTVFQFWRHFTNLSHLYLNLLHQFQYFDKRTQKDPLPLWYMWSLNHSNRVTIRNFAHCTSSRNLFVNLELPHKFFTDSTQYQNSTIDEQTWIWILIKKSFVFSFFFLFFKFQDDWIVDIKYMYLNFRIMN